MVQGEAKLILDLGNSETRGTVLFGKNEATGRYNEASFELSNRFATVKPDYMPPSDYSEETSTIFQINAKIGENPVTGVYANGEVQLREFNTSPIRPYAMDKKYESITTVLSFEVAMLQAMRALMSITRVTDYKQLAVDWSVFILLPPGDLKYGKSLMEDAVLSVKRVECAYPDVDFDTRVKRVVVLPEGYCAFMALLFDKGCVVRPEYQYLAEETTLVIDIGAGTTDILIMKDKRIIESTMTTFEKGGNNVTQGVKRELRVKHGIKLNETDIIRGTVTGIIKDGAKEVDICDIINDVKDSVASSIITDIQDFFEETEFPIRSISRLLVCGGGSVSSEDDIAENQNIKAISESIIARLKRLSPNVELIDIPVVSGTATTSDGVVTKVQRKMSPRRLNIIGASILAETM